MKTLYITLFSLFSLCAYTQSVVSSGGQSGSSTTLQASATIGESIIGSNTNGTPRGNQGFQQPLATDISTSIKVEGQDIEVRIFPIPANQSLTIAIGEVASGIIIVSIMDISGALVSTSLIPRGSIVHKVDLTAMLPGMYTIILQEANSRVHQAHKFTIIR